MSRLGIYVVYDKQGIIDRYAVYIAEELRNVSERLVIVCVGEYEQCQLDKLNHITNDIFLRDNKGYDSGAFKDALCSYIGWDEVLKYDEVVICNDTFYGPFWGFEPIFKKMADTTADFWGLTLHKAIDDGMHHFPTHVQSYFLVFRKRLMNDDAFRKFWEDLKYPTDYDQARDYYEMAISTIFPNLGYSFATYVCDEEENENSTVPYDLPNWRSYYATAYLGCPIIKKKRFTLDLQLSDDLHKTLEYVKKHSDYDISMVWENAIRSYSLDEINKGYHLRYVGATEPAKEKSEVDPKVHVVAVLSRDNDFRMYLDRIGTLSEKIHCTVVVHNRSCEEYVRTVYPRINTTVMPTYRNVFLSLNGILRRMCIEEKYILFCSNMRKMGTEQPQYVEEMAQNNVWDNLLNGVDYITQIVNYMESCPEVGMLVPNNDEMIMGDVRSLNWEQIETSRSLFKGRLGIHRNEDICGGEAFASTSFFIRNSLVSTFFKLIFEDELNSLDTIDDEKAMQLTLPQFAKCQGYLPSIVENDKYAAMMRTRVLPPRVETRVEEHTVEKYLGLYKVNLNHFVKHCKFLYIYGAGKIADQVTELLHECQIPFDGYVVSDGQVHNENKDDRVIREFSETVELEGVGYIVAVGEKLRPEVLGILERQGIENIYVL